jgi:hypothetical protein
MLIREARYALELVYDDTISDDLICITAAGLLHASSEMDL